MCVGTIGISDDARLLRNVEELSISSPYNEASCLDCDWANPALGRRESGRKERAGISFAMACH